MVETQLVARGVRDPEVLRALRNVPRHRFVPRELESNAYADRPLSIGQGQTISQPYIVAFMTEQLKVRPEARVLEVGTGSGYQAAVLAELGARVYSVERDGRLAAQAARRLRALGYPSVRLRTGDGSLGWPEEAPFDRILVTAYAPEIPTGLLDQLSETGRMLLPLGEALSQTLTSVERPGGVLRAEPLCGCVFVPLVGAGVRRRAG